MYSVCISRTVLAPTFPQTLATLYTSRSQVSTSPFAPPPITFDFSLAVYSSSYDGIGGWEERERVMVYDGI